MPCGFNLSVLESLIALPARHIEPEVAILNMSAIPFRKARHGLLA
jgi:hypothetical protein